MAQPIQITHFIKDNMKELKPTHPQISDGGIGAIIERVQKQQAKAIKVKPNYAMLQLPKEIHTALKQYCAHHGFNMSGFVASLIRQALANNKKK